MHCNSASCRRVLDFEPANKTFEDNLSDNHFHPAIIISLMDNTAIHTHQEIDNLITSRGHSCIYLLPYSPELNLIEQFWAIIKNRVKRSTFEDKEDLHARITEACNSVPENILINIIQHSVGVFPKKFEVRDPFNSLQNDTLIV
ncbi:hypothetical protein MFLAVUS_010228 [Mucor flavus]|uniref:Tc1-like transposase DDE domain-containing protein n=1 Tax=Mucor flavus TaxID=439312 RepID=A0ABP9ZC94_9FUNG